MRTAYVNGAYVPHLQAAVHIEDRGYQFSDGIYEYIAFYNRTLVDGDAHFRRLERSLAELRIAMPVTAAAMRLIVRELIARNGRVDGGLYIQISRGVARRDHPFPKNTKPSLIMTICGTKLPKPHEVENGVNVITHADLRWARRDIKSISLLANILAKQEAASVQAREAWLIDGDHISEGAASNAYIVTKNNELVTHPATQSILGGITRETVLALARKAKIIVQERAFTMDDVAQASEAFLTSTSANVLPVVQVGDVKIGNGKPGKITRQLHALYADYMFQQTGKQF